MQRGVYGIAGYIAAWRYLCSFELVWLAIACWNAVQIYGEASGTRAWRGRPSSLSRSVCQSTPAHTTNQIHCTVRATYLATLPIIRRSIVAPAPSHRKVISPSAVLAGEGAMQLPPPVNFSLSENFLPKVQNLGLVIPHSGIQGQN